MRDKLIAAVPFLGAALANLPIVYHLVLWDGTSPWLPLIFGFLAMGLAWGAGFIIEERRRWYALAIGVVGVLEGVGALAPAQPALGEGVRAYLAAAGVLSLAGLMLVARL